MPPGEIKIKCKEGFDGGLRQMFILKLYKADSIIFTKKSEGPVFYLSKAEIEGDQIIKVFSVNERGESSPATIQGLQKIYAQQVRGEHTVHLIFLCKIMLASIF